MTKKYIDFHSHTFYSDGLEEPETIVRNAKMNGLDALALTDHDTTEGVRDAQREARKWNIQLIPGVEITTNNYHTLGLNVDVGSRELQELLSCSRDLQRRTCERRINLMQRLGVPITFAKVEKLFPKSRLGKYNLIMTLIADAECESYMLEHGGLMSHQELFRKYFGKSGLARIEKGERDNLSIQEAIEGIHSAGGLAVLAHAPKDIASLDEVESLLALGLDGVEIQPSYKKPELSLKEYWELEAFARERNLKLTYGSDYHGAGFPHRPLLSRGENLVDLNELFGS